MMKGLPYPPIHRNAETSVSIVFRPRALSNAFGSDVLVQLMQTKADPPPLPFIFQELFPVFVLNLECPRSEVDMMAEPDKTLVEFSDWPSAKNTPIALLLVSAS